MRLPFTTAVQTDQRTQCIQGLARRCFVQRRRRRGCGIYCSYAVLCDMLYRVILGAAGHRQVQPLTGNQINSNGAQRPGVAAPRMRDAAAVAWAYMCIGWLVGWLVKIPKPGV
jgi:hypothetical protein